MVAASSRRTDENVASRKGSGRHCLRASLARALSLSLCKNSQYRVLSWHIGLRLYILPKEAAHDVLKQSSCLLLHELADHVAENRANRIETFIGGTDIVKTVVIEENFLHDEDGHCLAQLGACLHDAKTKGYYLRRQ